MITSPDFFDTLIALPSFETIKISQEINFNGLPTWISIGGTLLPGEHEHDGLRSIQKSITDYKEQEEKAYRESKIYQVDKLPDEIKGTFAELAKCLTLAELKGYWLVCKSNLALSTEYKKREKQLTDAK